MWKWFKGMGVTAQKIEPVISRFGPIESLAFLKTSEKILMCHNPSESFQISRRTNNNCFRICDKNVTTFKVPYYICGKMLYYKGPYYICRSFHI